MPEELVLCFPRALFDDIGAFQGIQWAAVYGASILVGVVDEPTFGIDTPADYEAFVRKWRKRHA